MMMMMMIIIIIIIIIYSNYARLTTFLSIDKYSMEQSP